MWQEHVLACGQQPGDVLDTVVKQSIICHWGLNPLPSQLSDDSQPVVLSSMARQIGTPSRISNVPYFSAFNADQMTSFIDRQVAKRHDYWPGDFASLTPVELRAEVMVSEQLELRRDAAFAFLSSREISGTAKARIRKILPLPGEGAVPLSCSPTGILHADKLNTRVE